MTHSHCDVAVVGAGPSGLAVATELRRLGVARVVVIEREAQAGGIPRHCGHSPFGMREFRRLLSGPRYARRLESDARAAGVELRLATAVTRLDPDATLTLAGDRGSERLSAARIVVCTGNRETPRPARMVSGSRPLGIVTTGALQLMTYHKRRIPFRRPVIVGSELVAFSALLTCRHFGIRPVAMLETGPRIVAWRPTALLPRLLGTRLLVNTSLDAIRGRERVGAVEISTPGGCAETIDCDGVIFSGRFVAESSLLKDSQVDFDGGGNGPLVDQFGRCSDPAIFACGNLLHPVETAGWCWAEGRGLARSIVASLADELPAPERWVEIVSASPEIRYVTPQRILLTGGKRAQRGAVLQIRFAEDRRGELLLCGGGITLARRKLRAHREQRILLPLPGLDRLGDAAPLALEFHPC